MQSEPIDRQQVLDATTALSKAGYHVLPATPEVGGTWHINGGAAISDRELVERADEIQNRERLPG